MEFDGPNDWAKRLRNDAHGESVNVSQKSSYTRVEFVPLLRPEAAAQLADGTLLQSRTPENGTPNYKVFQKHYQRDESGICSLNAQNQNIQSTIRAGLTPEREVSDVELLDASTKRFKVGLPVAVDLNITSKTLDSVYPKEAGSNTEVGGVDQDLRQNKPVRKLEEMESS